MELLHEGSAVALLRHLSNFWDECDGENIGQDKLTGRIMDSLAEGLFDIVPLAKVAANVAFQDESRFRDCLQEVYQKYALGYYRKRLNGG